MAEDRKEPQTYKQAFDKLMKVIEQSNKTMERATEVLTENGPFQRRLSPDEVRISDK